MPKVFVTVSTVANGSMYNRHDPTDAEIIRNRTDFLKQHGITLNQTSRLRFVFGGEDYCRYHILSQSEKGAGMRDDDIAAADAIVTTDPDHALALPIADCVGATLYDPDHGVLMLTHLGRHSLEQNGGRRSVEFLTTHFQTNPARLHVWLTPAPNKDAYPIWALNNQGMKEAALEQLHDAGVVDKHITDNSADTVTDRNFFSYSEFLKGNRDVDGDHMMVAMMTK
jgi:copper oxidase (laccase) domain-containing protein